MNTGVPLARVLTQELVPDYSVGIAWPILFVLILAGCAWAAYRRESAIRGGRWSTSGCLQCLILVGLGVSGLLDPGPGGLSLKPFDPSVTSAHGLFLGVVFSIFLFTGWEGAATVAEETRNPRKLIPRALIGSIAICGVLLSVASWGMLVGWGVDRLASFNASSELPPFILAKHYWGAGGVFLLLAVLNSVIVICLASTIVITRMTYALARAGIAPAWFGELHPRYRSPANATIALLVFSLILGTLGAVTLGAADFYFVYGFFFTILLIIVYIAGNYAVGRYFLHDFRSEFSVVKHVILPLFTTVALVYVGYKSVVPLPANPVGSGLWIAIGWIVVALGIAIATRKRTRSMDLAALAAGTDQQDGA